MKSTMRGVTLHADWQPRPGFKLGAKDIDHKQTYLGSKVWKNPKVSIDEHPIPEPKDDEVLIEMKAVGICGSDVHMNQATDDGYIFYPGLTGFPAIIGHEISGVVVKGGKNAFDKRTMKPFKGGEPVCAEEMVWCAKCRPCADGLPNHCEKLDEIGFNINGGFARYIVLPSRLVWSLEPLRRTYKGDDIFLAGSLVEPTSVAYTAMIQWGGGVRPGDNVVICGGGPIGIAALRIMKTQGAATLILSEPEPARQKIGKLMGADHVIDPTKENFAERVLAVDRRHGCEALPRGHRVADHRVPRHRAGDLGGQDSQLHRRRGRPRRRQDAGDRRGAAGSPRADRRLTGTLGSRDVPARHRGDGGRDGHDADDHEEDQARPGSREPRPAAHQPDRGQDHLRGFQLNRGFEGRTTAHRGRAPQGAAPARP